MYIVEQTEFVYSVKLTSDELLTVRAAAQHKQINVIDFIELCIRDGMPSPVDEDREKVVEDVVEG